MKIGVVSDIHCNIQGLRDGLALMGPIDRLICLGDSILQFRFSNEVVGLLRELDVEMILGNHEEIFFHPVGHRAREAKGNDPTLMAWLEQRPTTAAHTWGGKRLLLVHSTPWSPRGDYIYPGNPLLKRFGEADADIVFYGHTHAPLAQRFGQVLVVNPGSAGEGRDHRNNRALSCATVDLESDEVKFFTYPDPTLPSYMQA
jgi:putative phosphoesterase